MSRGGLPNKQRGPTTLILYAFRVSCLTTILDSRSLECENNYRESPTTVKYPQPFWVPPLLSRVRCKTFRFRSKQKVV